MFGSNFLNLVDADIFLCKGIAGILTPGIIVDFRIASVACVCASNIYAGVN